MAEPIQVMFIIISIPDFPTNNGTNIRIRSLKPFHLSNKVEDDKIMNATTISIQCIAFNSSASILASCDLMGNVVLYDGQVINCRKYHQV